MWDASMLSLVTEQVYIECCANYHGTGLNKNLHDALKYNTWLTTKMSGHQSQNDLLVKCAQLTRESQPIKCVEMHKVFEDTPTLDFD